MITTSIGKFTLTDRQVKNWVASGVWKRFSYVNGEVIGVSDIQPSQAEIDSLKLELNALTDQEPQAEIDEKNANRARKRQLLDALATLTSLTRKQVLRCFNEIVRDGNDD